MSTSATTPKGKALAPAPAPATTPATSKEESDNKSDDKEVNNKKEFDAIKKIIAILQEGIDARFQTVADSSKVQAAFQDIVNCIKALDEESTLPVVTLRPIVTRTKIAQLPKFDGIYKEDLQGQIMQLYTYF